jgi:hypothetical protein
VQGGEPDRDSLGIERDTMRALGYRTIDLLVDLLARQGPPLRRATPAVNTTASTAAP